MYRPKKIRKTADITLKPVRGMPIFLAAIDPVKPTIAPIKL